MINLGWDSADRQAADPCPPSVLIVDDDAAKRLALSAVLSPLGFTIVEAHSGEAALRCLVAQDFAVILLDVRMPVMDGFETAALIRLRQQSEMTPIIFVTAYRADEMPAEKYNHGAVFFMFAPVEPDQLRAKVSFFADMFLKAQVLAGEARAVQASADQLRLLIDAAPIGIFQTDVDNKYRYTNPQWSQITGISAEDAIGRSWDSILVPAQLPAVLPRALDGADRRADVSYRCSIEQPDSSFRIALIHAKPITNKDGVTAGWVGTLSDVTGQVRAEAATAEAQSALESLNIELAATARRDPLTGLNNRLALKEDLDLLEARVARYGHRYSVALLDVDHFKAYNDAYGHQAGDDTLRAVAAHLQELSREGDAVYRYGGEEFLCVFPEQDLAAGVTAAQRMRTGLEQLAIAHAENLGGVVTVSGGVATLEPGGLSTVKEVLKDADDALYRAKQRGRNRIEPLCSESGTAAVSSRGTKSSDNAPMSSVGELRDAIAAEQLEVYYQPVVDLVTGAALSAEALVRWNHPLRGVVGPVHFIPLAEESGLIAELTGIVIDTALRHTAAWAAAGRPLKCAVNLSAKLLTDAAKNASLLAKLAANPGAISVEVTESTLADDAALGALRELADSGVEIALDDFGTGYSSLALLKDMPVTVLKIDRAFVRNLDHDERDVAIIEMIAHLAQALGLEVIAEGIETEHTAGLLRASGITQAQGYLYAHPMPLSAFDDWRSQAPVAIALTAEDASNAHPARTTLAHTEPVGVENVDVTQVLLDSTRTLLRVTSSEQAVDALIRAVADLGGTYIPAALAPDTVIPIDISLGHADPLLLMAPPGSQARRTIERVLPGLVEDARVAADAAVRRARVSEQVAAVSFAELVDARGGGNGAQ